MIVAAAIIMGTVFAAFILSADRVPKEFGLLLAVAILCDALIVRMTLIPSMLTLLGEKSWYIPRWLDRVLPNLTIEPPDGRGTGGPEAERRREAVTRAEPGRRAAGRPPSAGWTTMRASGDDRAVGKDGRPVSLAASSHRRPRRARAAVLALCAGPRDPGPWSRPGTAEARCAGAACAGAGPGPAAGRWRCASRARAPCSQGCP